MMAVTVNARIKVTANVIAPTATLDDPEHSSSHIPLSASDIYNKVAKQMYTSLLLP